MKTMTKNEARKIAESVTCDSEIYTRNYKEDTWETTPIHITNVTDKRISYRTGYVTTNNQGRVTTQWMTRKYLADCIAYGSMKVGE